MLLVIAAPLVSRWLAHSSVPEVHAHHAALPAPAAAMAHGMHPAMHHPMGHPMPAAGKPTDPHADHEMGVDCEYCLIAARLLSLLVAVLLLLCAWPAVLHALCGLLAQRRMPLLGTLGARGPPVAFAA